MYPSGYLHNGDSLEDYDYLLYDDGVLAANNNEDDNLEKNIMRSFLKKSSGGWCESWVLENGKLDLWQQCILMLHQLSVYTSSLVKSLASRWELTRVQFLALWCLWLWWAHYPMLSTWTRMGTTICRWFGYNGWIFGWITKPVYSFHIQFWCKRTSG